MRRWVNNNAPEAILFGLLLTIIIGMIAVFMGSIGRGEGVESGERGVASCKLFTEKPKIIKCSDGWTLVFINATTGHISAIR